jgi:hypothetical protein
MAKSKVMRIERFEDIETWQLARELTRKAYEWKKKTKFARDFCLKRKVPLNSEPLNAEPVNPEP